MFFQKIKKNRILVCKKLLSDNLKVFDKRVVILVKYIKADNRAMIFQTVLLKQWKREFCNTYVEKIG